MVDELDKGETQQQKMKLLQADQEACLQSLFSFLLWQYENLASSFLNHNYDSISTRASCFKLTRHAHSSTPVIANIKSLIEIYTHYGSHLVKAKHFLYPQRCPDSNEKHPRHQNQTLTQAQPRLHPTDHSRNHPLDLHTHMAPHSATATHHQQP